MKLIFKDADFTFGGETRLKKWWRQVKNLFDTVRDTFDKHTAEVANGTTNSHVKLSDNIDSASNVGGGYAATPAAVRSVRQELKEEISSEATTRALADSTLDSKIGDEITARQNGDKDLKDNIDAEETARELGDSTLSTKINDEVAARKKADSDHAAEVANGSKYGHVKLSDGTNSEYNFTSGYAATPLAVKTTNKRLDDEATARQEADNNHAKLEANGNTHGHVMVIDNEQATLGANDGGYAASPKAVKTVNDKVIAETAAREAADNALEEKISKIRFDYFGDGSSLTFEWSGDAPTPYFFNGDPAVDVNLSGWFRLDGVPCGTMETATILLYRKEENSNEDDTRGLTYIVVDYDVATNKITVHDSVNYVNQTKDGSLCTFTAAKIEIAETVDEWTSQEYTAEFLIEGLGFADKIEQNRQDIAALCQPTFTEASSRQNINSDETLSTLFGKIRKWFTDLKAVAFTGSYSDLSNKPTIPTKTSQLTNDSGYKTTDTTYAAATTSAAGLMSATDKQKLNGIESGANKVALSDSVTSTLGASDSYAATPAAVRTAYIQASTAQRTIEERFSSGKGWYRIAVFNTAVEAVAKGSGGYSCDIIIRKSYSASPTEYHHLRLVGIYGLSQFENVANMVDSSVAWINSHAINQIRHVVDTANKKAYIDIYYDLAEENSCYITINNGDPQNSMQSYWEPCLEKTSDTASGTVYSTANILANGTDTASVATASYLTDLDYQQSKATLGI